MPKCKGIRQTLLSLARFSVAGDFEAFYRVIEWILSAGSVEARRNLEVRDRMSSNKEHGSRGAMASGPWKQCLLHPDISSRTDHAQFLLGSIQMAHAKKTIQQFKRRKMAFKSIPQIHANEDSPGSVSYDLGNCGWKKK
jgi:hypothetical protein